MRAPSRPPKEPIEAGTHQAICYCVCDLGTQEVTYPGKPPSLARQIKIQWELPLLRAEFEDKDGTKVEKPKVIGQTYTFSLYEGANLYKHLVSWVGEVDKDFEFESLISKSCMLSVIHKKSKTTGNPYARVAGVMMTPLGMPEHKMENPKLYYSIEEHGKVLPESLQAEGRMKWLGEIILQSWELHGFDPTDINAQEEVVDPDILAENNPTEDSPPEDDIPF